MYLWGWPYAVRCCLATKFLNLKNTKRTTHVGGGDNRCGSGSLGVKFNKHFSRQNSIHYLGSCCSIGGCMQSRFLASYQRLFHLRSVVSTIIIVSQIMTCLLLMAVALWIFWACIVFASNEQWLSTSSHANQVSGWCETSCWLDSYLRRYGHTAHTYSTLALSVDKTDSLILHKLATSLFVDHRCVNVFIQVLNFRGWFQPWNFSTVKYMCIQRSKDTRLLP